MEGVQINQSEVLIKIPIRDYLGTDLSSLKQQVLERKTTSRPTD
jgi:hypothetical protein